MPPLPKELQYQSSWDYRQSLLKKRIELVNADIVCLQEVSPDTFATDFEFMSDLGYDGVELFKKGRFRPATFWKTSKCELSLPAVHKDRCLLTAFRSSSQSSEETEHSWFVCNCHLQAGKQGQRRVRQISEALKATMTMARKLKECGAVRYLEDGYIDENFVEDGSPVSSGRKEVPLASPLLDAVLSVERHDGPPPTMVVSELISNLMEEATYDNPILSNAMKDRLGRIYRRCANEDGVMTVKEVEIWLLTINLQLNRGDEFREAAKQMGWVDPNPEDSYDAQKKRVMLPESGILTLEGFIEVYQKELSRGKFWGIAHDMAVLSDPLPDAGLFEARYDRIYCTAALQPVAVLDTLSEKPCPNPDEPSDHLPVAASFRVSAEEC
eukprot:scaffold4637_cov128-Cylindrotheca_fusiformis.AAC.1